LCCKDVENGSNQADLPRYHGMRVDPMTRCACTLALLTSPLLFSQIRMALEFPYRSSLILMFAPRTRPQSLTFVDGVGPGQVDDGYRFFTEPASSIADVCALKPKCTPKTHTARNHASSVSMPRVARQNCFARSAQCGGAGAQHVPGGVTTGLSRRERYHLRGTSTAPTCCVTCTIS
jgi:hypothetical protein